MKADESVHHVELEAAEGVEERVAGGGPGVVAAALELIPGVALLAVVARANGGDDLHALLHHSGLNHVNGRRVLESVHGLAGVGDGDHRLASAVGPVADDESGLVVEAVDAAGVVEVAHGALEVVLEERAKGLLRAPGVENGAEAVQIGVPLGEHLVDATAIPDLVLDLSVLFVPVGVGSVEVVWDRLVGKVETLVIVLAVEEVVSDPPLSLCEERSVLARGGVVAEMLGHLGAGLERGEVEAGEPRVGAEQLHVEGVVLAAVEDAGFLGVPPILVLRRPSELDGLLDRGPEGAEPVGVAADLPVAVGLDDAAELAVGAGAEGHSAGSEGELHAERHASFRALVVGEIGVANGALELGKEERQGLRVVPDVGAGAFAAARAGVAALPAIEGTVLKPQHRGTLQNRQVGGDGVECGRREV